MRSVSVGIVLGMIMATISPASTGRAAEKTSGTVVLRKFERVLMLEKTSETSANVSIGDVNGDGRLDLVLAKGRHDPLVDRVLLTDGRGHITEAYDLGQASDRSYSAELVDLDGDGSLDVVVCNDTPDPKLVYLNDGKGHFRVGSTFGQAKWSSRHCTVADLDGDGRPDIVVANRAGKGGANYICLNRGGGRFDADGIEFSKEPCTTITAADFNRDGLVDLAVPYRDQGQSYVYLNAGKASFPVDRRVPFGPPNATIRTTRAADLNGDGWLDLVAIDERNGVTIYFGQKEGGFSAGLIVAEAKPVPYALLVGDLNGDGKPDLVVGHVEAPPKVYFNGGDGRHFSAVAFGDNQGTAYGFAVADLDGDGLPDIAMARSGAPNVVYFADRP